MDLVIHYSSNQMIHSKHMEHMEITDKSYLDHMIPHHQVAVDIAKDYYYIQIILILLNFVKS